MINQAVARRYAQAFFALAKEKDMLNKAEQDLRLVAAGVTENRQLRDILAHKLIPAADKKGLTQQIFSVQVAQETLNFLLLTIDKQRELYWVDMAAEFIKLADEERNLSTANVTAAVELKREDLLELERKLSKLTGRQIKVHTTVDPTILGGLVVKIGDQVMDGSVQKRLEMLKNNIRSINFTVSGVN